MRCFLLFRGGEDDDDDAASADDDGDGDVEYFLIHLPDQQKCRNSPPFLRPVVLVFPVIADLTIHVFLFPFFVNHTRQELTLRIVYVSPPFSEQQLGDFSNCSSPIDRVVIASVAVFPCKKRVMIRP